MIQIKHDPRHRVTGQQYSESLMNIGLKMKQELQIQECLLLKCLKLTKGHNPGKKGQIINII